MKNFSENYDFKNDLTVDEFSSLLAHLIVKELSRIIREIRKEIDIDEKGD